jgi:RimJ/RimL family protein N-acetyltransferase
VDRIQAMIFPDNVGSRRVLEKCGFTFEGTLRKAVFHHGQYQDLSLYSILRSECPPLKNKLA